MYIHILNIFSIFNFATLKKGVIYKMMLLEMFQSRLGIMTCNTIEILHVTRDILKTLKNQQAGARIRVCKQDHLAFKPRHRVHLSPVDFLFSHPLRWRGIRATTDQPSYLSICGIDDEGDSSKFPTPPSRPRIGPGTANEILQRRTAERTRIAWWCLDRAACVFSRERCARLCTIARICVRVSTA